MAIRQRRPGCGRSEMRCRLAAAWPGQFAAKKAVPLAATAIREGGHVAIGIGDYAYPELGYPTNAEIVAEVARMARACGREVATPDEARAILGLHAAPASARKVARTMRKTQASIHTRPPASLRTLDAGIFIATPFAAHMATRYGRVCWA